MPNVNKADGGAMSSGPADPFDLASIRLDPNAAEAAGVEKLLLTVPVRKPHKQDYFRVHPGEAFRRRRPSSKSERQTRTKPTS
jgi:hypothetical protein